MPHVGSMWETRLHFPVAETQAPPQAGRAGRRILRLRWWRGPGNLSLRSRGGCEQGMRGTTPFDPPTFSCGRKQGPAAGGARRTENSEVEGVGVRRKFQFTLAGVGSGGGGSRGGAAHPSQVRCILMMPLLAHSAQNARNPYSSNTTPNRRLEQFKR